MQMGQVRSTEMTDRVDAALRAIGAIEPDSMAARLRPLLPAIDSKLKEGASFTALHKALGGAGFDIALATLRTYVQRYRRQLQAGPRAQAHDPAVAPAPAQAAPAPALEGAARPSGTEDAGTVQQQEPTGPANSHARVTPSQLDALMRPNPAQQQANLARYEHAGRRLGKRSQARDPPS